MNENGSAYQVVIVCDFTQVRRILDVYRFFEEPPRIVLVRRGESASMDPRLSVKVQHVPFPVITLQSGHTLSAFLSAALYLLYSFVSYCKVGRENSSVKLVHAHFIFPQGLFGLLLARLLRVPLIVTAAGTDVRLAKNSILFRTACRFVTRQADLTIAVSRPLQRVLRQLGVTNSIYLPNSVDTSSIHPESSRPQLAAGRTILFVGDLIDAKRPVLLIRAFERVLEKIPEAILIMVGDGALRYRVREEVLQRGLAASVKFFPCVAPPFVIQLLVRASVFVLPSVHEGLSLALLEAMAAGKVIVASANESHREILRSGSNALLFQPDNEEELAEHLISALTNDQLRSRLSESARRLCLREFSNSVIGRELEGIYMNTILTKSQ